MAKLPLRVQVGIRDSWDQDNSPVRTAMAKLKDLFGIEVVVEPQWQLLLAELDKSYPDKSIFVPAVAECVASWCEVLHTLASDDAKGEWLDSVLDRVKTRMVVFLEVCDGGLPTTFWSSGRNGFIIALPKAPLPPVSETRSIFHGALLDCFNPRPAAAAPEETRPGSASGWTDVVVDTPSERPALAISSSLATSATRQVQTMPTIATIPRPDELLLRPPYHLRVSSGGTDYVEVQCSHSPSLQLLAEYVKKWCKLNFQDSRKPPCIKTTLHASSLGPNLIYERLTLEAESRFPPSSISPMVVLHFVESVLGYKSVHVGGSFWLYRRDSELRRA
jgi:hypothetical protein